MTDDMFFTAAFASLHMEMNPHIYERNESAHIGFCNWQLSPEGVKWRKAFYEDRKAKIGIRFSTSHWNYRKANKLRKRMK